jgi:hypothetical protein
MNAGTEEQYHPVAFLGSRGIGFTALSLLKN